MDCQLIGGMEADPAALPGSLVRALQPGDPTGAVSEVSGLVADAAGSQAAVGGNQ